MQGESDKDNGTASPRPRSGTASGERADPREMTLKRLRAKAIDLLARRDHSEKELEDKLRSRGGEESDVAAVLMDLRGIGLLDDRRFATGFLSYRSGKAWGPRRYRQELLSRGVAAEIVDEVLRQARHDPTRPSSAQKLLELVRKELRRGREPRNIVASMVRRGFEYGAVREAFQQVNSEQEEPPLE